MNFSKKVDTLSVFAANAHPVEGKCIFYLIKIKIISVTCLKYS
jgi:hypothetical protein